MARRCELKKAKNNLGMQIPQIIKLANVIVLTKLADNDSYNTIYACPKKTIIYNNSDNITDQNDIDDVIFDAKWIGKLPL